jgi:hypothetical protein
MDLVDEQDVSGLEVREDRDEVAGPLEGRARRHADLGAHLGGDDMRQARLAEPRRTGEQQVRTLLAPLLRGTENYREVLLDVGLSDELIERSRTQGAIELGVVR